MTIRLPLRILLIALLIPAAHAESTPGLRITTERSPAVDARCSLRPEPGPCKGLFNKFYYDPEQKACRSFIYGGCQGVVPFDDRPACEQACGSTPAGKSE